MLKLIKHQNLLKLTTICGSCIGKRWVSSIKNILDSKPELGKTVTVQGWVKSLRAHKEVIFLHISDGSCLAPLQVVGSPDHFSGAVAYGSCVEVEGVLVASRGKQQPVDVNLNKNVKVLGACDPVAFPFKLRKHHPPDYLREFLHLRPRTNSFASLLRIRSAATKAIHDFFQSEGYCHIHTPMITSNDCEGAGEIFQVEPADKQLLHRILAEEKEEDYGQKHFFNVPAFLTVSGQLHLEVASGALSRVYTFGPTFRAENSRSRHHLSEFYMVEAELAFTQTVEDLNQVMEQLLKSATRQVLDTCEEDIHWFLKYSSPKHQQEYLDKLLEKPFIRLSYTEAIEILEKNNNQFETKAEWGCDLQKEHERHLVAHCGYIPVFITDYPAEIKPFYARANEDQYTVAAVDLLAADVGEICGGSLREERLEPLEEKLGHEGLLDNYQWYVDLRRYGSAPHGGFGLGFERYLQTLLGIKNIKDTIPFPRSTHNCKM